MIADVHVNIFWFIMQLRVDGILIRGLKWRKLLDPNKKGQWWSSGDLASNMENVEEVAGTIDKEILETKKMLELAASQRMNTDARRAIFCVIMSGEDYIDAFEKLLRLDLAGKQVTISEGCSLLFVWNLYQSSLVNLLCTCRIERSCGCLWSAVYRRKYLTSTIALLHLNCATMTKTTSSLCRFEFVIYLEPKMLT